MLVSTRANARDAGRVLLLVATLSTRPASAFAHKAVSFHYSNTFAKVQLCDAVQRIHSPDRVASGYVPTNVTQPVREMLCTSISFRCGCYTVRMFSSDPLHSNFIFRRNGRRVLSAHVEVQAEGDGHRLTAHVTAWAKRPDMLRLFVPVVVAQQQWRYASPTYMHKDAVEDPKLAAYRRCVLRG